LLERACELGQGCYTGTAYTWHVQLAIIKVDLLG